jgi:thymidylate synthase (FAD)
MNEVKLIWATSNADDLLAYIARVSNPQHQDKPIGWLFDYMYREGHNSPFQMANACLEINAPRDISRQIMRHWSMYMHELDVQEFSQRYQSVDKLPEAEHRECRMQDAKNRQNSLTCNDPELAAQWEEAQREIKRRAQIVYEWALDQGIAKEQARAILPEGLTMSRFYLNGNYRSWIYFLKQRQHATAQKEIRQIADRVLEVLRESAPVTMSTFFPQAV